MKKPIILSLILSFLVSLGGVALGAAYPTLQAAATIALIASLSLAVIFYALHKIFAKGLIAKLNNTKIADGQRYFLKHREEAEKSAAALLQKMKAIRVSATLYTLLLTLIGLTLPFSGGMLYGITKALQVLGVLSGGVILLAVGARIPRKTLLELNDNATVLSREDYPTLFSLIDRAKNSLGVKKDTVVILSFDANASITADPKRIYLTLGILLLHLLSEKELYAILLHEFSHVSDSHKKRFREKEHHTRVLTSPYGIDNLSILSGFFLLFDLPYVLHYSLYQYASAILEENRADRAMIENTSSEIAASALIKLEYDNYYRFENNAVEEIPIYAADAPTPDFIKRHLDSLKQAIATRKDAWHDMIKVEILANNASHPTLKMRLASFGIDKIEAVFPENSPSFQNELDKLLEAAETKIFKAREESYESDRKKRYLDPLADVTAWENEGKPILAEGYADVIDALELLCRFSDAEALCDRAIESLPDASAYQAYFTKGCYLLYRYDESGLDYIYHAIENNHNYLEDGLTLIGLFCCMTGREKALADYRSRALTLAQKNKDEDDRAGYLEKGDALSRDTMPDKMREEIIRFILSVADNIIENIYLVRKTISESFFTSAFIIHFYGGTDEKRDEIMHKIFRYLDSYPIDWQFSLFDYFEVSAIKVDKIEGSLVWSKKEQQ